MPNFTIILKAFCYVLILFTCQLQNIAESNPQPTNIGLNHRQLFYHFSSKRSTWSEAFQECLKLDGLLVTPANPVLDNSVRLFMVGSEISEKVWTGGRVSRPDAEGRKIWFWETFNLDFSWTKFHSPACETLEDTSCLLAYHQNGDWGWCGLPCNDTYHYICEFGTHPATTTTTEGITTQAISVSTSTATVISTGIYTTTVDRSSTENTTSGSSTMFSIERLLLTFGLIKFMQFVSTT